MTDSPARPSATIARRGFLALGGSAAAAAALAACTASSSPTGPATPTPTPWAPPAEPMPFPADYLWGTATSAYQVEGETALDGRGPSIWDTFAATRSNVKGGATGDPAADQYHRYEADADLMSDLGVGAYRFSISWSRILPTGSGAVNQAGLDHYRAVVDALVARGIRPAITLFHWDLPQALQDAGGWGDRETTARFAEYARTLFDAFGDVEIDWLTINEPKTHAFVGHWYGVHAPGLTDPDAAAAAVHHQMLAHGLAVREFRASGAKGRIGIALNLLPVYPIDPDATGGAERVDASENRLFLDPVLLGSYPIDAIGPYPGSLPADATAFEALQQPGDLDVISEPCDLLAIQYYGVTGVDDGGNTVTIEPTSAASWQQIRAEGLYDLLTRLRDDYPPIPILITENGMPDPLPAVTVDDPYRVDFLRTHFQQAARAIDEGVPLIGHFVWSLLDNFEWAEGYSQRWGIVAVDFATQERMPKASAGYFSDVIAANAVSPD
ncbi:GH1 family beta-glucosidase [Agromyces sp. NPDC058110]|uniref:GH1 family beta-glucosidase n=1 Tax=Agromyces sp. NPDC058110 TaxID=3346345 RepID=UPI0036D7672E